MAMEWEDITEFCQNVAAELKQTEKVCPMIHTPTFSLYDSMSAVEIMDPKMDQCYDLGKIVDTNEGLYKVEMPLSLTFSDLVRLFQRMVTLEVAHLNGYSILESTHTCLLLWHQCWPYFTRNNSLTSRIIYAYATCMTQTLGQLHQSVVTADIYEDEDFSPLHRSLIYDNDLVDEELFSRINAVIAEVESINDPATATLVALLSYRRDLCHLACGLESYTFNTIALSANALRAKQQNPTVAHPRPKFPNPLFVKTYATKLLPILTLLQQSYGNSKEVAEEAEDDVIEQFFRPHLARLVLLSPVKAVTIPTIDVAYSTLIGIMQDLLYMHRMTEIWNEKTGKSLHEAETSEKTIADEKEEEEHTQLKEEKEEVDVIVENKVNQVPSAEEISKETLSFEFLLLSSLQLCHAPQYTNNTLKGGRHIIARSFFIAALHTTAITLDYSLLAAMSERGCHPYITTHQHTFTWIRTTPMMLAWDMLKATTVSRNRVINRLTNSVFPTMGIVITESLMLDEQMRRDPACDVEMHGPWNVAYTSCLMTEYGDLYLQLLLEQGLIDAAEHDYIFWQWDHLLTSHIACLDRVRALRLALDVKRYEDWSAEFEKKKAERVKLQLQITNGGIADNDRDSNKNNGGGGMIVSKKKKKNQREIDTAVSIAPPPPQSSLSQQQEMQQRLQQLDNELALRQAAAPPAPAMFGHTAEDLLRRGKAMVCRGIFRVVIALKQLGLMPDPRNEYCSKASIFKRRFGLFADILSPNPLTFNEFLDTINRDALSKPQFAKQAKLAQEQEATFLADVRSVLQQASKMYQQARMQFDEARKGPNVAVPTAGASSLYQGVDIPNLKTCTADQAVLLLKVCVASGLAVTKLLQFVSEEAGSNALITPANIKLRLKVNFSYHVHFPVYEVVAEEVSVALESKAKEES